MDCATVGEFSRFSLRPEIKLSNIQAIVTLLHAIHNCAAQKCEITMTRAVHSERQLTGQLVEEYRHDKEPNDVLLNLCQIRSAWIVQEWQPHSHLRSISVSSAAQQGLELQRQRAAEAAAAKAAREVKKAESAKKKDRSGTTGRDWRSIVINLPANTSIFEQLYVFGSTFYVKGQADHHANIRCSSLSKKLHNVELQDLLRKVSTRAPPS